MEAANVLRKLLCTVDNKLIAGKISISASCRDFRDRSIFVVEFWETANTLLPSLFQIKSLLVVQKGRRKYFVAKFISS